MNVDHDAARTFYEIEAERSAWPVEHLARQIHSQLFARLLKSRDKDGVMDLAQRGHVVERPIDLMKSPVVLDFLDLPDSGVADPWRKRTCCCEPRATRGYWRTKASTDYLAACFSASSESTRARC